MVLLQLLAATLTQVDPSDAPGRAEIYYHLGRIHQSLDNENRAYKVFAQARSIDPFGRWREKPPTKVRGLLI